MAKLLDTVSVIQYTIALLIVSQKESHSYNKSKRTLLGHHNSICNRQKAL